MDPQFVVLVVLGGLAMAGRLRRGASAAGSSVRSGARAAVSPVQRASRQVPLVGGAAATVLGAAGTVIGESVGEVLDGLAVTTGWIAQRPPGEPVPTPAAPAGRREVTTARTAPPVRASRGEPAAPKRAATKRAATKRARKAPGA